MVSRKNTQKPQGFLDDLSPEQENIMNEVINWIKTENILDMQRMQFNKRDTLRFCRARKFDLGKIKTMVQNYVDWYEEEQIHDLYETWEFPEERAIKQALPHGLHQCDKQGRPIFIRRVGIVDFDAFFRAATSERIVRHITWQNEEYRHFIYPAMSRVMGRHIESNC